MNFVKNLRMTLTYSYIFSEMASQEVFPSFTCITCRVVFVEADTQRSHYKTDWHRYNLKRKVADMPPVTAENFAERVQAQRTQV